MINMIFINVGTDANLCMSFSKSMEMITMIAQTAATAHVGVTSSCLESPPPPPPPIFDYCQLIIR